MWSPLSSESPSPSHRQLGRKIPESCSGPPLRRCYGRDPTFRPPRPAAVAEVLRWRALRRQLGGVSPAARRSGAGRGRAGLVHYFLFLPFLADIACCLSNLQRSKSVHVQVIVIYRIYTRNISVSLASAMPLDVVL